MLHLFILVVTIGSELVGVLPHLFEFISGKFSNPPLILELAEVLPNFRVARDQVFILENSMRVFQDQLLQIYKTCYYSVLLFLPSLFLISYFGRMLNFLDA